MGLVAPRQRRADARYAVQNPTTGPRLRIRRAWTRTTTRRSTSDARTWTPRSGTCGSKGIALDAPQVAHYGMKQLYLKDPDGYTICFQWKA